MLVVASSSTRATVCCDIGHPLTRPQRTRDDLGTAVVPVELRLCDDNSDLPRHGAGV
jgi:hypothetical protein